MLCSISCTLDLILSALLVFRWSGGAVRSSPVAQGLQHRLCWLRKRRDSRRGGTTSGWGCLKQSQNITLFCQIVWHHVPPNTMSTAVIIFLFFVYFPLPFILEKLHCFNYNFVFLVCLFLSPSLHPTIIKSPVSEHGVTRQAKSRITSVLFLWQTTENVLAHYLNSGRWGWCCLCRLDCLLSVP